jgi:hypothetical protein
MAYTPLSAADLGVAVPCEQFLLCKASPHYVGEAQAKCRMCRFAQANGASANGWRPLVSGAKHPQAQAEKFEAQRERAAARFRLRLAKSKPRQRVAKQAEAAERGTEREIIKATVNSGRRNQDLDHVSRERILLDTKSQSKNEHPVVRLAELDKARRQAREAGYPIGGLVLVNKYGRRVVAFDIEDYAKVVK